MKITRGPTSRRAEKKTLRKRLHESLSLSSPSLSVFNYLSAAEHRSFSSERTRVNVERRNSIVASVGARATTKGEDDTIENIEENQTR